MRWPILIVLWITATIAVSGQETALSGQETAVSGQEAVLKPKLEEGVAWYDGLAIGVEGKYWSDTRSPFDRLPPQAEKDVRAAVWSLSRHSAGMCIRFQTDAPEIWAKWELTSPRLEMPHMPATGVSGLDLYVRHQGTWRWLAVGIPRAKANKLKLVSGLKTSKSEFCLFLPLYNGVESISIGVPQKHDLQPLARAAEAKKPIVFYGTSITQGGCASRTGMVHTAILGRRLNRPVINLGFSGNGRMELEVAKYIAEIDAAAFVLDCLPNMKADEVAAQTEPVVKMLRSAHPKVPILLAEDRTYSNAMLIESTRLRNVSSRKALQAAFKRLQSEQVPFLYYLSGDVQLADALDNLATVDGSHPTDLGFVRMADAFEPILRRMLGQ